MKIQKQANWSTTAASVVRSTWSMLKYL